MPRGKNYVNNNRGVSLQASKKKKASQMVACMYGAGCTRSDCIYRHPHGKQSATVGAGGGQGTVEYQSREPCMPFLAGICTFAATGCRKRHPPRGEAERLIAKYRSTNCRFGDECRTRGCLYLHPSELEGGVGPAAMGGYATGPGMATPIPMHEEPSYVQPPPPPPPPQSALRAAPVGAISSPTAAPSSAWKPSMPGISGQFCTPTTPQRGRSGSGSSGGGGQQRGRSGSGSSGGGLSAEAGAFVPRSPLAAAASSPRKGPVDLSAAAGEFVPGSGAFALGPSAASSSPAAKTTAVSTGNQADVAQSTPSVFRTSSAAVDDPWARQQQASAGGGNPWATDGGLSTFGSPGGWR